MTCEAHHNTTQHNTPESSLFFCITITLPTTENYRPYPLFNIISSLSFLFDVWLWFRWRWQPFPWTRGRTIGQSRPSNQQHGPNEESWQAQTISASARSGTRKRTSKFWRRERRRRRREDIKCDHAKKASENVDGWLAGKDVRCESWIHKSVHWQWAMRGCTHYELVLIWLIKGKILEEKSLRSDAVFKLVLS